MKKIFAAIALVAALFIAGQAQAQISINAGYAPETFTVSHNNNSTSTNYQGFFVGVTDNFTLAKGIGVAPGLQFRMNTKSATETFLVTTTTKNTQMLIDIPVLLNYRVGINRDLAVTPFVGPMFSYAIVGNTKTTVGNTTNTESWYGDNSGMNPFNINLVFGASLSYNKAKLYAGYRFGLIDQDKSDYTTTKTKGFFVGLGYAL